MNPFSMLQELLDQNQFELLFPDVSKEENRISFTSHPYRGDLRLVYLMNDAVESFLVFCGAVLTGEYRRDYKDFLEMSLCQDEDRYVLSVRQKENVVTIHFQDLKMEVHLYDYGEIGHFWMRGFENLRQLEFKIAILHDKLEYLGEAYCSQEEKRLAELANFPPLNACSYPAVPAQYRVEREEAGYPSKVAFEVMKQLAVQASDLKLLRALKFYEKHCSPVVAKGMAHLFRRNRHRKVLILLTEMLKKAAAVYPKRSFGNKKDEEFAKLLKRANLKKEELNRSGIYAEVLREEPFETEKDSVNYHVYVMQIRRGFRNVKVTVQEISDENLDDMD